MGEKQALAYPFAPKSNAFLEAGHIFPLPLSDGRFAAGQVLSVPTEQSAPHAGTDTRTMVVGLLNWSGATAPAPDAVVGRRILDWGFAHIKTITELPNGAITGWASVDSSDDPRHLRLSHGRGGVVGLYRLGVFMRAATTDEVRTLPVMSTYGFNVLTGLAERVFVSGLPIVNKPQADLPALVQGQTVPDEA